VAGGGSILFGVLSLAIWMALIVAAFVYETTCRNITIAHRP